MIKQEYLTVKYCETCLGVNKIAEIKLLKPEIKTWECDFCCNLFCEDCDYYTITQEGYNKCLKCSKIEVNFNE